MPSVVELAPGALDCSIRVIDYSFAIFYEHCMPNKIRLSPSRSLFPLHQTMKSAGLLYRSTLFQCMK